MEVPGHETSCVYDERSVKFDEEEADCAVEENKEEGNVWNFLISKDKTEGEE